MEPEIYDFIDWVTELATSLNIELLPEVHAHYNIQYKLAGHGNWIYDFILPYMILSTLTNKSSSQLKEYLKNRPHKQFTMLDCHDGIPVKPDLDDLVREIELYAYEGIKFFGIDSKMKISVKGNDPEHLKISKISSTLSKLCAKKDIIIFLINQISEDDMKSKRLSLKGSGDQKYDADLLFFLTIDKDEKRWLHCTKNRMSDILFKTEITKKHNSPIVYEFKGDDNIKIDMPYKIGRAHV